MFLPSLNGRPTITLHSFSVCVPLTSLGPSSLPGAWWQGSSSRNRMVEYRFHDGHISLDIFWVLSLLIIMSPSPPLLEGIVPILTAEAESEILYPNHHGCKLLNILGGYVEFLFSYQDVPPTFVHST